MTSQNRAIIHESGHVILARIYSDIFTIKSVTVNPEEAVKHDKNAAGGMHGGLAKPIENFDPLDHDKLCLIFFAGMAADDLANCQGSVDQAMLMDDILSKKITNEMYDGDIKYITVSYEIINQKAKTTFLKYMNGALSFLYEVLSDERIASAYESIIRGLINSPLKSLSSAEIEQILSQTDIDIWITENKTLLESRNKIFNSDDLPKIKTGLFRKILKALSK